MMSIVFVYYFCMYVCWGDWGTTEIGWEEKGKEGWKNEVAIICHKLFLGFYLRYNLNLIIM